MDLRKYQITPEQIARIKPLCGYQPFILSDTCHAGVAHAWVHSGSTFRVVEKGDVSRKDWKEFVDLNQRMRNMYDSWVDSLCRELGSVEGLSVADTGCDQGYFLWRLKERGAGRCVGYDREHRGKVIDIMNEITGYDVEYVNEPYNQMTHEIAGAEPADIVVSTAFMCHLSDPTYYLNFIGKLARKAILLWSRIYDDPAYIVRYDGAKAYDKEAPFPVCFDALTHVSRGLIEFGLKELGFSKIVVLPHRRDWIPPKNYQGAMGLIAIKE